MIRGHRFTWWVIVATSLALLSGPGTVAGADTHRSWGLYLGLNVAKMGGDMDQLGDDLAQLMESEFGGEWSSSIGTRMGPMGGAYHHWPLSRTFGLQVEGMWVRRGTKLTFTTAGLTADTDFKVSYLELPLLARWSPASDGKIRFFLVAGPVVGFKTSADMVVTVDEESETVNAGAVFQSTVFSLVGGIGLEAEVGDRTSVHLQARYQRGLTDGLNNPDYSSGLEDFSILGGLSFAISP